MISIGSSAIIGINLEEKKKDIAIFLSIFFFLKTNKKYLC